MTTANLKPWLKAQEGYRAKPYKDSLGNWTGGVGHLLNGGKSSAGFDANTDWDALFDEDIETAEIQLDQQLPWWRKLSDVRQDVMVSLFFNLGPKLVTWKHTLADIENGNFKAADIDLLNDQPWASQVKSRAQMLATQMETNIEVGSQVHPAVKVAGVVATGAVIAEAVSQIPSHPGVSFSVGTQYLLIGGGFYLLGVLTILVIALTLHLLRQAKPAAPANIKEILAMFLQSYQPILDYINAKQAQSVADAKTISDQAAQIATLTAAANDSATAEQANEADTLTTLTAATNGDGVTAVVPPTPPAT